MDEEGNAVHEPCYAKEVTTQDCPSPKLHSHGMNPRVTLLHPQAILRAGEVGVWQITDSKSAPRTWSFDEGQSGCMDESRAHNLQILPLAQVSVYRNAWLAVPHPVTF